MADADCDYVVVGSGAGGGTLAARLAEAGMRVVVLEAGGDPRAGGPRLPADYDVPAFHPFASENPKLAWNYFVRHYGDEAQQRRDPKLTPAGILYPRAGTLGGCTAHNAMILMRPHDADWNGIFRITGDRSWRADRMQLYWRLLENCHHRPLWRVLGRLGINPTGHGWNGWLSTEMAMPLGAMEDHRLLRAVVESALAGLAETTHRRATLERLVRTEADPNDIRTGGAAGACLCYTPLSTAGHARVGTRERLLAVAKRYPDRLRIETHALATRVILDAANRAVGVEYLRGERLYRAAPNPAGRGGAGDGEAGGGEAGGGEAGGGEAGRIVASREVILAGGAFNSPQLLMLSGIGGPELAGLGIPVRVPLPGVGRNLQDRYEVAVVNKLRRPWAVLSGARFEPGDPLFRQWSERRDGMYISNGAALAVSLPSSAGVDPPDLFCMGLLAKFDGYYPGYSKAVAENHDYLSWTVLKAHTGNRAGRVSLRSSDPRDPPQVDFNYFAEGGEADLRAVVTALRFVRGLAAGLGDLVECEEEPGSDVRSDEELGQFVRDRAWGHHASCTCPIGPRSDGGVLDSGFRVHGVSGLRVVDASVFPRIPGFFIAGAIYMAAEKAADVILADAAAHRS